MIKIIAMIIIMVVMVAFSILILINLSATAGVKIRGDMKKLLRSYDTIIDKLKEDIETLTTERDQLMSEVVGGVRPAVQSKDAESKSVPEDEGTGKVGAIPKTANYRTSSLGRGYDMIRQTFGMDDDDKAELVYDALEAGDNRQRGEAAGKLAEELSFDTVFSLSRLSPDEQLATLYESLNDDDRELLMDFLEEQRVSRFDSSAFWNWLKEIEQLESSSVTIRCGDMEMSLEEGYEYQEQICEGIQIKTGSKIYDYSIKEREIS